MNTSTTLFIKSGRYYRPANRAQVCEMAAAYQSPVGESIRSSDDTLLFLKAKLAHLEHEIFAVIYLDNRHRVLAYVEEFRGTIDGTSVHPREIVKAALKHNAAAVIFAHNHPSGVAEPSQADERITARLKSALELIDVRVLDHLIIAGQTHVSFASSGLL